MEITLGHAIVWISQTYQGRIEDTKGVPDYGEPVEPIAGVWGRAVWGQSPQRGRGAELLVGVRGAKSPEA